MYGSLELYRKIYPDTELEDVAIINNLEQASLDVDIMTYNRIKLNGGINELSEYQQGIINVVACEQAYFTNTYADEISSPYSAYSINGVSMTFDLKKIRNINGIYTSNKILSKLQQTGLIYRGI